MQLLYQKCSPALFQPPDVSGCCWQPAAGLTGSHLLAAERQQAGRLPVPADMLTNLRQMAGTLTSASLAPTSRLPHAPITSIVDPEVAGRPDSLAELSSSTVANGACVAQAGGNRESAENTPDLQTQRGQPDSAMSDSATVQQGGMQVAELCCAVFRVRQEHTWAHTTAFWRALHGCLWHHSQHTKMALPCCPAGSLCLLLPCRPPCSADAAHTCLLLPCRPPCCREGRADCSSGGGAGSPARGRAAAPAAPAAPAAASQPGHQAAAPAHRDSRSLCCGGAPAVPDSTSCLCSGPPALPAGPS